MEIPNDFSRKLKKGDTAAIQIVVDGTDSNTTLIALGYAGQILSEYTTTILVRRLSQAGMTGFEEAGVKVEHRTWFNPNFESRLFYVPAVIAAYRLSRSDHPYRPSHCKREGDRDPRTDHGHPHPFVGACDGENPSFCPDGITGYGRDSAYRDLLV